jgi:hypothetical protein
MEASLSTFATPDPFYEINKIRLVIVVDQERRHQDPRPRHRTIAASVQHPNSQDQNHSKRGNKRESEKPLDHEPDRHRNEGRNRHHRQGKTKVAGHPLPSLEPVEAGETVSQNQTQTDPRHEIGRQQRNGYPCNRYGSCYFQKKHDSGQEETALSVNICRASVSTEPASRISLPREFEEDDRKADRTGEIGRYEKDGNADQRLFYLDNRNEMLINGAMRRHIVILAVDSDKALVTPHPDDPRPSPRLGQGHIQGLANRFFYRPNPE